MEPKPSVLVAEDDLIARTVFGGILRSLGCSVVTVENGQRAVEEFCAQPFDLLVLDWNMPMLDGMEVAKVIRSIERGGNDKRVSIVIISANLAANEKARDHLNIVDGVFEKPFGRVELQNLIEKFFHPSHGAGSPS
jgi:CheY-like chemotaxis protein